MKNKKINIEDNIQIKDSTKEVHPSPIIGKIKIYDDNGNLIVEKNNMVVISGRQLLLDLFVKYFTETNNENTTNSPQLFLYLSYQNFDKYAQTVPELTFSEIHNENYIKENLNTSLSDILKTTNNNDQLKITFHIDISSDKNNDAEKFQKFNQIYIAYSKNSSNTTESDMTLFSRVALDPIYLSNNSTYKLDYSLYF